METIFCDSIPMSIRTLLGLMAAPFILGTGFGVALALLLFVGDPEPGAHPAARVPGIVLDGVTGAPSDGNEQIDRHLRALLSEASMTTAAGDDCTLIVSGTVSVEPAQNGDLVIIVWTARLPNGEQVAQVVQKNTVAAHSLNAGWGEDAGHAAMGARNAIQTIRAKMSGGQFCATN